MSTIPPKKYTRKVADLPDAIEHLTMDNFRLYVRSRREEDTTAATSVMVAYEVLIPKESEGFKLEELTLDHLTKFSRNVGLKIIQLSQSLNAAKISMN
jgi:hypothetical protein